MEATENNSAGTLFLLANKWEYVEISKGQAGWDENIASNESHS